MPYYYNPGFNPYPQQQYPQQMQQQPAQPQQAGIIWVQGEVGAKGYMVAPNNSVVLWDNENPVIYLKSADASGMPTLRVFDYKERVNAPVPQSALKMDYVTHDELNAILDEFRRSKKEVNEDAQPDV